MNSIKRLKMIINGSNTQAGLEDVGRYLKNIEDELQHYKERVRTLETNNKRLKEAPIFQCSDEELNTRYKAVYFDYLKQRQINQELVRKYRSKIKR